jgi:hypothetical protein
LRRVFLRQLAFSAEGIDHPAGVLLCPDIIDVTTLELLTSMLAQSLYLNVAEVAFSAKDNKHGNHREQKDWKENVEREREQHKAAASVTALRLEC